MGEVMLVRYLRSTYPIVRWRDHWGYELEHKQGDAHQVDESAPWMP